MNTLSEHEADRVSGRGRPVFIRLLGYVRPYLGLIALTLALSLIYGGGRFGRAYLLKPIMDDIIVPSGVLQLDDASPIDWLPALPIPGLESATDSPPEEPAAREQASVIPRLDETQKAKIRERIRQSFLRVAAYALLIVIGMPAVTFARDYLVLYALGRMDLDMKLDVCAKLLALPLRAHQEARQGDLLARIMADLALAHGALSLLFSKMLQSVMMIFVGVGALLFVSWRLTLVMLLIGPLVFGVISLFGRRIRKSARRRQEQFVEVTQRLLEILQGIKVIKAFRAEQRENQAFGDASHRLFRRGMKVVKIRVLARTLIDMVNNGAGLGVLMLGIVLVLGGRWGLTGGDLAAFAAISTTVYMPVKSLARGWAHLMDAEPSADRFFEVLDMPIDILDAPDAVAIEGVRESIRFDRVNFSYGREPVLQDVSLDVAAGEVVALVGRTGAGKSTLIDLLMRFYDPTEGAITIDGVDLRQIARDSLFDHMAVVTQQPFLFDGSIGENIRYGRHDATDDEVLAAAKAAYVDEFVSGLPDGYGTTVGVSGARLSGGQRQRITIARAILRDPAILIFDEATSSLDSKSERYVQQAIDSMLGSHRTVFVIAHRLSTVRRADKIVVLDGGVVTQMGTHDELVAAGGLYHELVKLQGESEAETASG